MYGKDWFGKPRRYLVSLTILLDVEECKEFSGARIVFKA